MSAVLPLTNLMQSLVADHRPATVLWPQSPSAIPARFERLDACAVGLLLYLPVELPTPGTVACVQFLLGDEARTFLATVEPPRPEAPRLLFVVRPAEAITVESRRAFRVPLASGTLPVELVGPRGALRGQATDISQLGVGVVCRGEPASKFTIGDSVRVRFRYEGVLWVLSAAVIQMREAPEEEGTHVGFSFTQDVRTRIRGLVAKLEADWRERNRA